MVGPTLCRIFGYMKRMTQMKEILIAMVAVVSFTACEKDIINPVDPFPIDTTTNPVDTTPPPPPPPLPCNGIDTLQVDSVYRPDTDYLFGTGKYGPSWINGDHSAYEFCGAFNAQINFNWDQGSPFSSGYANVSTGYRQGFMNGWGTGGNIWTGTYNQYVCIVWKNGWEIIYAKSGSNGMGVYNQGNIPVYINSNYPGVIFNSTGKAILLVTQK